LGIAIILAAVAGAVVAYFDGDPETKVDPQAVVAGVSDGVGVIRGEDAVVPAESDAVSSDAVE
jgi:hypothetical protein